MRIGVLIYFGLVGSALLWAAQADEQFIMKKSNKRAPSASQMKEEIGDSILDVWQEMPDIDETKARGQKELAGLSRKIIDDNCLSGCTKEQLQAGHEHALAMHECVQKMHYYADKFEREVKALVGKVRTKAVA